jgi:HK97 family phage major capsid protein
VDATGYGEFLQDVMAGCAPSPSVSPRLAAVTDMATKSMKAASGLNVAIPSQGGFFVQTDHNAELVREMITGGQVLSGVRRIPLGAGADSVTFNGVDETSRASTIWGGILAYWVQEATAATASKPKFREIKLETKGLAALYYATDKLLKLAPALGAEVSQGFREAMTFKVEDAIINGTGAGKPLGLMNAGSLVSVTKESGQAATTILHDNMVKMKARLFPSSWANAVWLSNPDCSPQIDALAFGIGVAGVLSPYVTYGADGITRVLGRPVVYTEHCQTLGTTGDLILWDPASYYFIDLGAVEEASSIHVAFTTYDTCFRFIYYCDGQPKLASALTPAHGSNTLTNQVKLDTRS